MQWSLSGLANLGKVCPVGAGKMTRIWWISALTASLLATPLGWAADRPSPQSTHAIKVLPATDVGPGNATATAPPQSILGTDTKAIDLDSALRLGGVRNPQILIARQRVIEAVAQRQLAAAQILPNINGGTNYNNHSGNLQQSDGNILSVHRQALYLGAGANAVGSGTVNIPGVSLNLQLSDALFSYLQTRQVVARREFAEEATRNEVLLQVSLAYEELLRAEALRAIAVQIRVEAAEVARLTDAYARTGQGRKADADRAATERSRRDFDILDSEGNVLKASARLSQLLDLDPSSRLHGAESSLVPTPIVPDIIPLPEFIAIALLWRPELRERRAAIREALLALNGARALPFAPNVIVGFSAGTFGGGSNLVTPQFGSFGERTDFDTIAYWSLRNLGIGNRALINVAASRWRSSNYQALIVLDRIRDEVAEAYARIQARFAQIATSERAVRVAKDAFAEDLRRIRGREGLPIEVLDSLRLSARARYDYLNAIVDYNRAHFELYVALGQPPADVLARVAPPEEIPRPIPKLPAP
jgi:outer membrane protein TolC